MNDPKRLVIIAFGATLLILFALFIKNHADTEGWKTAYKYNIAIAAEKQADFNYDVDSQQGLVLTHGDFVTPTGTKFDEMTKDYTYVEKVHEHYTMHTYTTCSGKPQVCTTHIYYSWDYNGSDEKYADKVVYFARSYPANTFTYGNFKDKINACDVTAPNTATGFFDNKQGCNKDWLGGEYYYEGNDDRFYYNAVPLKFTASFFVDTSNKTLANPFGGSIPLETRSIDQMRKDSTGYKVWNNIGLTISSIIILIACCVIGYNWVMADGKWSLDE